MAGVAILELENIHVVHPDALCDRASGVDCAVGWNSFGVDWRVGNHIGWCHERV